MIGKGKCLVHMTENTVAAFRQAGCDVGYFPVNGVHRLHEISWKIRGKLAGGITDIIAEECQKKIRAFQPDLIVFVLGAWQDERIYQAAQEAGPNSVRAAWVGDVFTPREPRRRCY